MACDLIRLFLSKANESVPRMIPCAGVSPFQMTWAWLWLIAMCSISNLDLSWGISENMSRKDWTHSWFVSKGLTHSLFSMATHGERCQRLHERPHLPKSPWWFQPRKCACRSRSCNGVWWLEFGLQSIVGCDSFKDIFKQQGLVMPFCKDLPSEARDHKYEPDAVEYRWRGRPSWYRRTWWWWKECCCVERRVSLIVPWLLTPSHECDASFRACCCCCCCCCWSHLEYPKKVSRP